MNEQTENITKEYLELVTSQGLSVVDTETGDIISAFDISIPIETRADIIAFLLGTLEVQEEATKQREKKLKDRRDKNVLLQEKIRESFKEQMLNENVDKVKTIETTWYFMNKKKLQYNIDDIAIGFCEVELKAKLDGHAALSLTQEYPNLFTVTKKKPLDELVDELVTEGKIQSITQQILCKR